MVASRATRSERTEMVSITRYSCLSGFQGSVSRAVGSVVEIEVMEACFSSFVEGAITDYEVCRRNEKSL